jgi:hypothetical protein
MKGYPLDGNPAVTKMASIEISGNIIPLEWFNHIKMPNGKPDAIGVILLSDIVYWYRPIEERDEQTGKVKGYRKKFAADMLQRNYDAFADLYGFTKDQVRDALKRLEDLKVIELDFRHPVISGRQFGNVLFIGLNVEALCSITHTTLSDLNPTGYQERIPHPIGFKSDTNTEITTEITTEGGGKPTATANEEFADPHKDEPVGVYAPFEQVFIEETGLPIMSGGPKNWYAGMEAITNAGATPEDFRQAIREQLEAAQNGKRYNANSPLSFVNATLNVIAYRNAKPASNGNGYGQKKISRRLQGANGELIFQYSDGTEDRVPAGGAI